MRATRREFCWSVVAAAAGGGCGAAGTWGEALDLEPDGGEPFRDPPDAAAVSEGRPPGRPEGSSASLESLPEVGPQPVFEFLHGVASGDPWSDRVILWTRVTPQGEPEAELSVDVKVFSDRGRTVLVRHERARTSAARDFCVKLDLAGLSPATTYYYQFADPTDVQRMSPLGRTRTLPEGSPERARLAVVACSCYAVGYFHAYAHLAQRHDLDFVVHLGDYIYEYGLETFYDSSLGRPHDPPHETLTLADYRRRHAQYKQDPDLAEVHRQHPFVCVWDDHEVANNAWAHGASNHDPIREGDYDTRRAEALQAYREWMPIRELDPLDPTRGYRSFAFGDLFDLIMLETRNKRSRPQRAAADDPTHTLLGAKQESWLYERLSHSQQRGARWRLLGQQVMLAQLKLFGQPLNIDQWDGYEACRQRLFDHLRSEGVDNLVVLTGDIHSSWASELAPDPYGRGYDRRTGEGALAVEMVCTSVSSPALEAISSAGLERLGAAALPHVRWFDLRHRGYLLLDVDRERVQGEWYHAESVSEPYRPLVLARAFQVPSGRPRLSEVNEASPPIPRRPATV